MLVLIYLNVCCHVHVPSAAYGWEPLLLPSRQLARRSARCALTKFHLICVQSSLLLEDEQSVYTEGPQHAPFSAGSGGSSMGGSASGARNPCS